MSDRTPITTVEQAEAAVESACKTLLRHGFLPRRILASVAMAALLRESDHITQYDYSVSMYALVMDGVRHSLALTVTSTNPEVAFVTAYAE